MKTLLSSSVSFSHNVKCSFPLIEALWSMLCWFYSVVFTQRNPRNKWTGCLIVFCLNILAREGKRRGILHGSFGFWRKKSKENRVGSETQALCWRKLCWNWCGMLKWEENGAVWSICFHSLKKTPFLAPLPVSQTSLRQQQHKDQGFRTLEDFPLLYSCCQAQQLFTVAVMRMQVLKEPKRSINTF